MSDELVDIKQMLIEFNDGRRAHLKTDDEHTWVINCVPKMMNADDWCEGAKAVIAETVHAWRFTAALSESHAVEDIVPLLEAQIALMRP